MTRLGLAFRAARRIFRDPTFATTITDALEGQPAARPESPARSEALTLLAALQREARLIDFLMEPLDGYPDAQVGAAARDVHRDSAKVLKRFFDPRPLRDEPEGASIEVPAGYDPACLNVSGPGSGEPPLRGTLRHPGWEAARCDLPVWTGGESAGRILAPAELDVR